MNDYNNPVQEEISKLKAENEELKQFIAKRKKLMIDLKERCNEQNSMMNEIMKKIDNIKKFIPENSYRKHKYKDKDKDKLEEQLAIAAVEEQIIKELCPNNNQETLDKIYGEKNNNESNKIKDKIIKIPQVYYKENEFDIYECSICIDKFKENELLKKLKCGHVFHKECLSQWFLNMNNCPTCNQLCE